MNIRRNNQAALTGVERHLLGNDIIVSKTDPKGRITYVNDVFCSISGYSEAEMIGAPHSVIRHPDMPRAVFKLLWESILSGNEIFAYVVNRCKNGDHYWVLAHVTPSYDLDGKLVGYHSNRRAPKASALEVIRPIYRDLLQIEKTQGSREGLIASSAALEDLLRQKKLAYDQFVLTI